MGLLNCVLLLWIPLAAFGVPFEDCGSLFYLQSVEISGCSSYPCSLRIGSSVNVTVDTLAQVNSVQLQQEVYFVVNNIRLRATVSPNPCTVSNDAMSDGTCGLQSGQHMQYHTRLSIEDVPPLPATLYWMVTNESTEVVVCYKTTVILTH